jgi:hypothetical protein
MKMKAETIQFEHTKIYSAKGAPTTKSIYSPEKRLTKFDEQDDVRTMQLVHFLFFPVIMFTSPMRDPRSNFVAQGKPAFISEEVLRK